MFNLPHQSHPCRYYHDERNRKWLQIELFLYFFHIPDPAKFICVCVCVWMENVAYPKRILRQFKFVSQSDRRKMPAGYFEEKNARSCNPGTRLFTHQKKFFRGCRISPAAYQSYAVIWEHTRPARKETFFLINQSTLRSFLFYSLASSQLLWNRKKIFFHFLLLSFLLDLTSCWLIFL